MKKLGMHTANIVCENILKIKELFPNCIKEFKDSNGELKFGIDFEMLKQELSDEIIESDEKYEFNWPGKKNAILISNSPTNKTLRPCKEESVNWDTTQNLYLEGDNLEILKILRSTYLNKIKIIYIDPPYNTGKDYIYKDDFKESVSEYLAATGQIDDEGNRLIVNSKDTNGRFHTDWLNMIYPRLKLARDLLSDDGVIFISIDNHEVHNLRKICDDIFGSNSFINVFMWLHGKGKKDTWSRTLTQYIIAYAKDKAFLDGWTDKIYTNYDFTNPDNDPKGKWFSGSISFNENRSNPHHPNYYSITSPTGITWTRQWQISENEMYELIKQGDISWGDPIKCDGVPRKKIRPSTIDVIPKNIFENVGTTCSSEKYLKKIMNCNCFSNPKPIELIKHILNITNFKNNIVLDFFSGSSTTAHAVMQLNAEDGGNRRFIMVQLPEPCNENSEAFKAGYKNICEIGKERIRRAGKKIIEEIGKTDLDIGFRVFKLDSSNMEDTYYLPQEYNLSLIKNKKLYENIKKDRTQEDLLFQVMLQKDFPLSAQIKEEIIDDKRVFSVDGNNLICCFEDNLTEDLITKIISQKLPRIFVTRNNSIDDNVLTNISPIIQVYSPETELEVI